MSNRGVSKVSADELVRSLGLDSYISPVCHFWQLFAYLFIISVFWALLLEMNSRTISWSRDV